jgi:hypothetical protein
MGQIAVDQNDIVGLPAISRSEQAHEFQTPGTAANDNDLRLSLSHPILPSPRHLAIEAYQGLACELKAELEHHAAWWWAWLGRAGI